MPEISKKSFIASFVFEVICDDSKIGESGNEAFQHYERTLFRQFLKDSDKVKRVIGQNIALEMGGEWSFDTFETALAGPVINDANEDREYTFGPSIDLLPETEREWWQSVRSDPDCSLSECIEPIFDCFQMQLVASQLQEAIPTNIVDATPATQYNEDIDSGDDYWGPIVRIEDEDELIMQRVSADEIFGEGFTKHLAEYREAEQAKQDAVKSGENKDD